MNFCCSSSTPTFVPRNKEEDHLTASSFFLLREFHFRSTSQFLIATYMTPSQAVSVYFEPLTRGVHFSLKNIHVFYARNFLFQSKDCLFLLNTLKGQTFPILINRKCLFFQQHDAPLWQCHKNNHRKAKKSVFKLV